MYVERNIYMHIYHIYTYMYMCEYIYMYICIPMYNKTYLCMQPSPCPAMDLLLIIQFVRVRAIARAAVTLQNIAIHCYRLQHTAIH